MSEKLLKVLLSELKTVRLTCPHCEITTEMTVEKMGKKFTRSADCPVCGKEYASRHPETKVSTIERLADAIRDLQAEKGGVKIQFVLPDAAAD